MKFLLIFFFSEIDSQDAAVVILYIKVFGLLTLILIMAMRENDLQLVIQLSNVKMACQIDNMAPHTIVYIL